MSDENQAPDGFQEVMKELSGLSEWRGKVDERMKTIFKLVNRLDKKVITGNGEEALIFTVRRNSGRIESIEETMEISEEEDKKQDIRKKGIWHKYGVAIVAAGSSSLFTLVIAIILYFITGTVEQP